MSQRFASNKEPPRKTITKKTHLEITVQGQMSTFYHSFKECFRQREIKNVKKINKQKKKQPQAKNPNKHIKKTPTTTPKKPQIQQ